MGNKPKFTEELEELDDILNNDPDPQEKPSAVAEDDDLMPDPPKKEKPEKPVKKAKAAVEDEYNPPVNDEHDPFAESSGDEGEHTGVEVRAEKCEFRIAADDFLKFLQKIELGGFIKDGYVRVEESRLYCAFTDQNTGSLYGFVGLSSDKGIEVVKTGSFIIQDLKKMIKIVNLLSGKIIVAYDNGTIRISSAASKKSAKVISYDKGYVDSLSGMASMAVDLDNGKIGEHNFLAGSTFVVKRAHLKEILDASDAIDNAEFRFNASAGSDEIMVHVSNDMDRINVPFKASQTNIKSDLNSVYSFPALSKVIKALGEDIQVFVLDTFVLFKAGSDHYVYMANETND